MRLCRSTFAESDKGCKQTEPSPVTKTRPPIRRLSHCTASPVQVYSAMPEPLFFFSYLRYVVWEIYSSFLINPLLKDVDRSRCTMCSFKKRKVVPNLCSPQQFLFGTCEQEGYTNSEKCSLALFFLEILISYE